MEIDRTTLQLICNIAAETAVERFCKRNSIKTNDEISQRTAYHDYGAKRIKRWEQAGKAHKSRVGYGSNAKYRYSRIELDSIERLEGMLPL